MKEIEWHELCRRQQEQGREVTGVTLIPRSAQELASEVLSNPAAVTFMNGSPSGGGEPKRVVAGGRVGKLVNWAADTVITVEVDPDADADTVTVRDKDGQVQVVSLAADPGRMTTPEHVTLTPAAAPAPELPPAFLADTDVQQVLKDDGTHHAWELTYRPTRTKVISVDRDLAVSDLGEVLASRGEIVPAPASAPAETGETVTIPRFDLDSLLAVATLYLGAFRPDERMTLPEKLALQNIEGVVERHGTRF